MTSNKIKVVYNVYDSQKEETDFKQLVKNKRNFIVYSRNITAPTGGKSAQSSIVKGHGGKGNPYGDNVFGITLGSRSGGGGGWRDIDVEFDVARFFNRKNYPKELVKNKKKLTTPERLIKEEFRLLKKKIREGKFDTVYFPCESVDDVKNWGTSVYSSGSSAYKRDFAKTLKFVTEEMKKAAKSIRNYKVKMETLRSKRLATKERKKTLKKRKTKKVKLL
tara:strand:+ start:396 stop:1055 length:660 start_codon:yes stop_codon:yes gene_type:complete